MQKTSDFKSAKRTISGFHREHHSLRWLWNVLGTSQSHQPWHILIPPLSSLSGGRKCAPLLKQMQFLEPRAASPIKERFGSHGLVPASHSGGTCCQAACGHEIGAFFNGACSCQRELESALSPPRCLHPATKCAGLGLLVLSRHKQHTRSRKKDRFQ